MEYWKKFGFTKGDDVLKYLEITPEEHRKVLELRWGISKGLGCYRYANLAKKLGTDEADAKKRYQKAEKAFGEAIRIYNAMAEIPKNNEFLENKYLTRLASVIFWNNTKFIPERLKKAMKENLSSQEIHILERRFRDDWALSEVAAELKKDRYSTRKVEHEALNKLRACASTFRL